MPRNFSDGKDEGSAEILTLLEAARLLRVSPSWLRRSECPRIRFGAKLVRYPRQQLLAWFNSRLTHSIPLPHSIQAA